jgi:hypothetical protein
MFPHKLIDSSTKEIMGILIKTDENQNAALTYVREIMNYNNQEWFKLNNMENSIVGSTKSIKELETSLINNFKNMENNLNKLNNGDTEYIIHQLENLEDKINNNNIMEIILKLSNDTIYISNQEKEIFELIGQNKILIEAHKEETLKQFLDQNNHWKLNHQQIIQMFELDYSLVNESINQGKEQGRILTKFWENYTEGNKGIINEIRKLSEQNKSENELQVNTYKQCSQTEKENQLLLGEVENQLHDVKKLLVEIKQTNDEEAEKYENCWNKIPERDEIHEKQQETIISKMSKLEVTLNATKNNIMEKLETFKSKENTSLEEIKWTIKNIQIYNQKEVFNSLFKIKEEEKNTMKKK